MQVVAQQHRRSPLEKAKQALERLASSSDRQDAAESQAQGQDEQLLVVAPAEARPGDQPAPCR